jgi:hypothetical protein
MIDIEIIKNVIREFVEKYNFIQEIDIIMVENSDFNKKNYIKINNKNFISINEYNKKIEIVCGKVNIIIDSIDEEEYYSIDKNEYFFVNIIDFTNEDKLIESIIKECKNHKLM